MADDPIDFELYRLETGLAAQIPKLQAEIKAIQATDISALKPRELGKLRDRLLRAKVTLMVCDPLQRERLHKIANDQRLTFEELVSHLDAPAVRFI
jgi:hypothetical protein